MQSICRITRFLAVVLAATGLPWVSVADEATDLTQARALFERNIAAIQSRDREAYLDCYRPDARLTRVGYAGMQFGFEDLQSGTPATGSGDWPDTLISGDVDVTWLGDGLVYGTYRYRVVFNGAASEGISERVFAREGDRWYVAVSTAFNAPSGTSPPPVALVGATAHDGNGRTVDDAVIVVRDGRIASFGPRSSTQIPDGMDVMDLSGRHVTPGIVDAHVHYSQTGWADGRPDATDVRDRYPYEITMAENRLNPGRYHGAFLASGVTAVFDVGGYAWTLGLRAATEDSFDAPHVSAAGPLLVTFDVPVLRLPDQRQMIMLNESSIESTIRSNKAQGADAIKLWFIARNDSMAQANASLVKQAGKAARVAGLPLIVHATTLATARISVEAGADVLVHSIDDAEVDDAFVRAARDSGTIYCPTLTVVDGYRHLFDSELTDGLRSQIAWVHPDIRKRVLKTERLPRRFSEEQSAAATERGIARMKTMATNLQRLHNAGVAIAMGTDAGNPLTLHGPSVFPEMEAMQASGLSPQDVLIASTRGAAAAMGRPDDLGQIETGRIADLLILSANPVDDIANMRSITHVMRGGRLHDRRMLQPTSP